MNSFFRPLCLLFVFLSSCAQILPPTGGAKDTEPPHLLEVTPYDSLRNTRVTRLSLRFDEFITLNNASSEIVVSPLLPFPLNVSVHKKTVNLRIPDSLLQANTTYRISFGKAIQDVHEGNPFTGYVYTFSTGAWFDSMKLKGQVVDAATGLNDSGAVVVLYDASQSDSAVVKQKPLYATSTNTSGEFHFSGLPERAFKIFAIKDANKNLMYDGKEEMIAFLDSLVMPVTLDTTSIILFLFTQPDTISALAEKPGDGKSSRAAFNQRNAGPSGPYIVEVDTSDSRRRTFDINGPLVIQFATPFTQFNESRVHLHLDSSGTETPVNFSSLMDSATHKIQLLANWREDTQYTLRLLKGFARDTAGNDMLPSKYIFRTKRDEDYAKMVIHLPGKYLSDKYMFSLTTGKDTVYFQPVTDTMIRFTRLNPGSYVMKIIVDANRNGKWDAGNLFEKRQPEKVIPYRQEIMLRPGWENLIDFEETPKSRFRK